jgi:hypothetical protein
MNGKPDSTVKAIVLVHGGFVDGSGWAGVYNIMRHRHAKRTAQSRHREILAMRKGSCVKKIGVYQPPNFIGGTFSWVSN